MPLRARQRFVVRVPVAGLAPRLKRGAGRSTCVHPARLEYMKRFGMAEMLSYIIAGTSIRLGCRSSAKHVVL